jgi:hypothetical protein
MRQHLVIPTLAFMTMMGGAALPAAGQPVVGGQAPGFSLTTLAGDTVALGDFGGQHVVLHFGAGW